MITSDFDESSEASQMRGINSKQSRRHLKKNKTSVGANEDLKTIPSLLKKRSSHHLDAAKVNLGQNS